MSRRFRVVMETENHEPMMLLRAYKSNGSLKKEVETRKAAAERFEPKFLDYYKDPYELFSFDVEPERPRPPWDAVEPALVGLEVSCVLEGREKIASEFFRSFHQIYHEEKFLPSPFILKTIDPIGIDICATRIDQWNPLEMLETDYENGPIHLLIEIKKTSWLL